jgi:hypothetical protein
LEYDKRSPLLDIGLIKNPQNLPNSIKQFKNKLDSNFRTSPLSPPSSASASASAGANNKFGGVGTRPTFKQPDNKRANSGGGGGGGRGGAFNRPPTGFKTFE